MKVTRRRVVVRSGPHVGLKGWGYFTESQEEWDSVQVVLDYLDPVSSSAGSALGAATRHRQRQTVKLMSFTPTADPSCGRRYGVSVRLAGRDLTILSDLESLADELNPLTGALVEYPRLK